MRAMSRTHSTFHVLLYLTFTALLSSGLLLGCEGETVDFDPMVVEPPGGEDTPDEGGEDEPPPGGEAGVEPEPGGAGEMAGEMGGEPPPPPPVDMGGTPGPMEVCTEEPDLEAFKTDVGPRLITGCGGSGCHGYGSNVSPLNFPQSALEAGNPLDDDQTTELLDVLVPDYIVYGYPEQSDAYTYGVPEPHFGLYQYGDGLAEWISTARVCELVYPDPPVEPEDMDPPPPGGVEPPPGGETPPPPPPVEPTQVFCDALPSGDPQGRTGFYETFEESINNILSFNCATSGCHDQPYPDYSFWVVAANEPCSVQANFIMSQLYINFNSPLNSPLLTYPIDPDHGGGGRIFPGGNSDPNYTAIRQWIVSGQN